jgi:hypothetical protein
VVALEERNLGTGVMGGDVSELCQKHRWIHLCLSTMSEFIE